MRPPAVDIVSELYGHQVEGRYVMGGTVTMYPSELLNAESIGIDLFITAPGSYVRMEGDNIDVCALTLIDRPMDQGCRADVDAFSNKGYGYFMFNGCQISQPTTWKLTCNTRGDFTGASLYGTVIPASTLVTTLADRVSISIASN